MAYIGSHIERLISSGLVDKYQYINDDIFQFNVNFVIPYDEDESPICLYHNKFRNSDYEKYNNISKKRINKIIYKINCKVRVDNEMVQMLWCDCYGIHDDGSIVYLPPQIIPASDQIYLVEIFEIFEYDDYIDRHFILPNVITSNGTIYSKIITEDVEDNDGDLICYGSYENIISNERLDLILKQNVKFL